MAELDPTATAPSDALAATAAAPSSEGTQREGVLDGLETFPPSTFEVGAELGRGGIGRVFRARDPMFDRPIAIKELLSDRPEARARFLREAMITARLQHPSIVPVYLCGRWPNGAPFYAMKLVDGKPLSALLRGAAGLDERIAMLPSLIAVCDAIAFAHGARIIQRDLKPGNVLVGELGETIVIDWGLAKDLDIDEDTADGTYEAAATSGETVEGSVFGTPAYMAPEQAAGKTVDERADVYALGAMLYELLVGRPPYADVANEQRALQVLENPPTAAATLVPEAPRDLIAISERAMQREPALRYPDARALVADLRRFTAGQLVSVREYGALERIARWMRKHRAAVAVAAVAAVVTLGIGVVAVVKIVGSEGLAQDRAREAEVARQRESERADAAIHARAAAVVQQDPTAAIAILGQLRTGVSLARPIAAEAASLGISTIVARTELDSPDVALTDDDRYLLVLDPQNAQKLEVHDLVSGTKREFVVTTTDVVLSDRTAYEVDGATVIALDVVSGAERRYLAPAKINYAAESPDRTWIAARMREGNVMWNAATGTSRLVPAAGADHFGSIAVTNDGSLLQIVPDLREVWVTSASGDRHTIPFPANATTEENRLASASPDSTLVVVTERAAQRIHVLDVSGGTWTALDVGIKGIQYATFSGDSLLVHGEAKVRYTHDDAGWHREALADTRQVRSRGHAMLGLGTDAITVQTDDRNVTLRVPISASSGVITRSGDVVYAVLNDQTIRRWDLRAMDGPVCGSGGIGFASFDGALIATADPGGMVVCDGGRDHREVLHGGTKVPARLIGDTASWILTAAAGAASPEIVRWQRSNHRGVVVELAAGWQAQGMLDDGRVVARSASAVELVDPITGATERRCPTLDRVSNQGSSSLVFGIRGKALVVCDVADNSVTELAADGGAIDNHARAANHSVLVVRLLDEPGQVIIVNGGRTARTPPMSKEIGWIAVSADGSRVAFADITQVRIVDNAGNPIASIPFGTNGERSFVLSGHGDRLLAYDVRSESVTLYDVATGSGRVVPLAGKPTESLKFVDDTTMLFIDDKGHGYRAYDRVPQDPAELERWLRTVTNAVLDEHGVLRPR